MKQRQARSRGASGDQCLDAAGQGIHVVDGLGGDNGVGGLGCHKSSGGGRAL